MPPHKDQNVSSEARRGPATPPGHNLHDSGRYGGSRDHGPDFPDHCPAKERNANVHPGDEDTRRRSPDP